jgi:hypothetical protein
MCIRDMRPVVEDSCGPLTEHLAASKKVRLWVSDLSTSGYPMGGAALLKVALGSVSSLGGSL